MAEVTMPQLGETVTEGTITKWFKQIGDQVAVDEVLFEVSTDKVDSEVPSPEAGYLARDQGARRRHRRCRHRAGRGRATRRPTARGPADDGHADEAPAEQTTPRRRSRRSRPDEEAAAESPPRSNRTRTAGHRGWPNRGAEGS
jgi:pyruvate dehydrogenase E2 component (dihydrolipoamide acetyltransferase)